MPGTSGTLLGLPNKLLDQIIAEVSNIGENVVDAFAEDPVPTKYIDYTTLELLSLRLTCRRFEMLAAGKWTGKVAVVNVYGTLNRSRSWRGFRSSTKSKSWLASLERLANSDEASYITYLLFRTKWPYSRRFLGDDVDELTDLEPWLRSRFPRAHALVIETLDLRTLVHDRSGWIILKHLARLQEALVGTILVHQPHSLELDNYLFQDLLG